LNCGFVSDFVLRISDFIRGRIRSVFQQQRTGLAADLMLPDALAALGTAAKAAFSPFFDARSRSHGILFL
jgi:hypothetical protein